MRRYCGFTIFTLLTFFMSILTPYWPISRRSDLRVKLPFFTLCARTDKQTNQQTNPNAIPSPPPSGARLINWSFVRFCRQWAKKTGAARMIQPQLFAHLLLQVDIPNTPHTCHSPRVPDWKSIHLVKEGHYRTANAASVATLPMFDRQGITLTVVR